MSFSQRNTGKLILSWCQHSGAITLTQGVKPGWCSSYSHSTFLRHSWSTVTRLRGSNDWADFIFLLEQHYFLMRERQKPSKGWTRSFKAGGFMTSIKLQTISSRPEAEATNVRTGQRRQRAHSGGLKAAVLLGKMILPGKVSLLLRMSA